MPEEQEHDDQTETEPTDTGGKVKDWAAEADKWKNLSRKHEATAKANADAAKRLAAMEESQKTAEQKAADHATAAEQERDAARLESARLRVAIRKGLTETQAKRLLGETEDELEKDADELLASFGGGDDGKDKAARRPKERLRSGAAPETTTDVNQLINERIRDSIRR